MLYPLPAVMVSCGDKPENYNILTIAWTGTIASDPPLCYVSVRKQRHSYELILQNKEFVINLTTEDLIEKTDFCGVRSGRDLNKWEALNLTPEKAQIVKAPLIAESPVNIECSVLEVKEFKSHDMFIAEVVAVNVDETFLDAETKEFRMDKARLITYSHGKYYAIGHKLGFFGYSVQKKKKKHKARK